MIGITIILILILFCLISIAHSLDNLVRVLEGTGGQLKNIALVLLSLYNKKE